jgi:hypothetical protein
VLPRPLPADENDEEFDSELDGAESLDDLWDSPDLPEHDANESR